MKTKTILLLHLFLGITFSALSQVKVGNNPNTINPNSILELESTNQGFLPPRMPINNLNAVAPLSGMVPAGMLIYSVSGAVPDGYYMWDGSKWASLQSSNSSRTKYVLVKSASDFPAAVGGTITLATGTLYEVNGTITLTNKIDLNGCTLVGRDPVNDVLAYTPGSGELFTGTHGGTIQMLTLTAPTAGSKLFNINAAGANLNFVMQNCYVVGCNNVGVLQGFGGTVYTETVAYFYNINGITYQNDTYLVIANTLWDNSNRNVYEKLIGNFTVVQIRAGDRNTLSANTAIALDVSGVTSVTCGSIKIVMFTGTGTYVNGTFSNSWEVESTGVPTQKDDVSTGNAYLSVATATTFSAANIPTKIAGTTSSTNLFRVVAPTNNRLTYVGSKTRTFMLVCSLSFTSPGSNKNYSFYFTKNGVKIPESEVFTKIANNADEQAVPIMCAVSLSPNDYIEVWGENNTDNTTATVETMNFSMR